MSVTGDTRWSVWSQHQLAKTEAALDAWVGCETPADLAQAMRYAVCGGGKRVRPLLVLAAHATVAGASKNGRSPSQESEQQALGSAALRSACSVELIHAYSLVHDDMPCMDNDVLRRGKPTVHVQFGAAQALLAGDALQALAFELLTPDDVGMPFDIQARLCALLARAAGGTGMAGGQAIDLASVGMALTEAQLCDMHQRKTGALLQASVVMGATCARADAQAVDGLTHYGAALGLAFQVVDDILDVTQDSAMLGKTAGKDAAHEKPTYVSLMGLSAAQSHAEDLHAQALAGLQSTGLTDTSLLKSLADLVLRRSN